MEAKKTSLRKIPLFLSSVLCLVLVFGLTSQVLGVEIEHYYKNYDALIKIACSGEVWQEVTEYQIPSSNFTAGKDYLIVINFSINVNSTSSGFNGMARVLHGTTPFDDSTYRWRSRRSGGEQCGHGYHYWTVWEAVSGEDIHIEITQPGTAINVRTEEYEAFVINLSDDVAEDTDWFYQTATHSGDLPTSWTPGASITFDGFGKDWLILAFGHFLADATTGKYLMRIYDVDDVAEYSRVYHRAVDADDYRPHMLMTGLTNVGSNHTVRVEAKVTAAGTHDWSDSKIFALNLAKFKDHWTGYSTTEVSLPIVDNIYRVYGKLDYSASQTGDVLIWSQEIADVGENTKGIYSRIQVDQVTVPTGHENAKRDLPWGSVDENAHHHIYLGSLNAGSRVIDIDMAENIDASPAPVIDIHSLSILSMELAICPTPSEPTNPSPGNGATEVSAHADLNWDDCTGTDSYDVYFDTVNPPATKVAEDITSSDYTLDKLNCSTPYYWKIVAKNFCGQSTPGPVWSFTTESTPDPGEPSGPAPGNGATGVSINDDLDWDDSSFADSYDVFFGTSASPPLVAENITNSDHALGTLEYSKTYYWKIVAKNNCGTTPGSVWSFTTEPCPTPGTPAGPTPGDGATGVLINDDLDWDDSINADSYDVYFGTSASPPLVAEDITNSDHALGTLEYSKTYYWKIVAENDCGNSTPGAVWSFTTEPCPIPGTPAGPTPGNGATGISVDTDLNWANALNADSYDVYFGIFNPPAGPLGNTTSSDYVLGTLEYSATYYWKVIAKNDCGNSTPGAVWSFTTEPCPTPGTPAGPSPSNGASGISIDTNLDWNNATNTDSYVVYFGTSNPPSYADNTTSSSYVPPTLEYNTQYYWKVVSENSCGNSTPGAAWSFTTRSASAGDYFAWSGGNNTTYTSWTTASTTIQAAIDAAYAAGGGTVLVRFDPYRQENATMKTGVDVIGVDSSFRRPDEPGYNIGERPKIRSTSSPAEATVTFDGVQNCKLEGFVVQRGHIYDGLIHMTGTSGSPVTNATVKKCKLENYDSSAPGIVLLGHVAPTIVGCDLRNSCGKPCIGKLGGQIKPTGTPIIIKGNTMYWSKVGIVLQGNNGAFDITIGTPGEGNEIYEMHKAGIGLLNFGEGSNVTISGNNIHGNGKLIESYGEWPTDVEPGIILSDVKGVIIKRNTIHGNHRSGITIKGESSVTVGAPLDASNPFDYGNDIYDNDYAGVSFGGYVNNSGIGQIIGPDVSGGPFVVRGNYIYSNSRAGIAIDEMISGSLDAEVKITENEIAQNTNAGIAIRNECTNVVIEKNKIYGSILRAGIHTGDDTGAFDGPDGGANLTVRRNKVYHNFLGGIDVRHASGTIENNLVYRNYRAGIRCGDHSERIRNNTVIYNGIDYGTADASDDRGGGIIYDDFEGAINDPPSGAPSDSFPIKNNICAYNVRAGIRACFYQTEDIYGDKYRDYNLLYSNSQAFLSDWCDTCASPDCSTSHSRNQRKCRGAQLGAGCDGETTFCCSAIGATGPLPGETLIFADPRFVEVDGNPYHLAIDSPAKIDGYGELGAYGGNYPIDDNDFGPDRFIHCTIDGDTSTGNDPEGGDTLYVDLGDTYTVRHVRLNVCYLDDDDWGIPYCDISAAQVSEGCGGTPILSDWELQRWTVAWLATSVDTPSDARYLKIAFRGTLSPELVLPDNDIREFQFSDVDKPLGDLVEADWLTPISTVDDCTNISGLCDK